MFVALVLGSNEITVCWVILVNGLVSDDLTDWTEDGEWRAAIESSESGDK